jgi:hypothetical protein
MRPAGYIARQRREQWSSPSGAQDQINLPGRGIAQGRITFLAVNQANSALCGNCGEIDLPTRCVSFQPWSMNPQF